MFSNINNLFSSRLNKYFHNKPCCTQRCSRHSDRIILWRIFKELHSGMHDEDTVNGRLKDLLPNTLGTRKPIFLDDVLEKGVCETFFRGALAVGGMSLN